MSLLSKNLKIQYSRNKLIPYIFPASWKTQTKLFQNCANLNTRQETVFKPNFVQTIVSLCKNRKKTSCNGKKGQKNVFIVQKIENTVPQKDANLLQISCFMQDGTKSVSKLRKLDKQIKTVFKPNCVQGKASLSRTCKETTFKSKHW